MAQVPMNQFHDTPTMIVHDTDLEPLRLNLLDHETRLVNLTTSDSAKVPTSRQVATSGGLQGGGDLTANRTISPIYGTAANTVAQGNDSRIANGQTAYSTTTNATYGNTALNTALGAKANASDVTAALGTGWGTNDSSGSSASGTVGAQLRYLQANGVGGGGGVSAGPLCVALATSTQSLVNGQFVPIALNSTTLDSTGSMHSNTLSNTRITVPMDGIYLISGVVAFTTGSASGVRAIGLRVNGVDIPGSANTLNAAPAANVTDVSSPTCMVKMTAGQFVEMFGYQTSGGAFSTFASSPHVCQLSVSFLRSSF